MANEEIPETMWAEIFHHRLKDADCVNKVSLQRHKAVQTSKSCEWILDSQKFVG